MVGNTSFEHLIRLSICLVMAVCVPIIPARGDTEARLTVLGPGVKGIKVGPGMNVVGRDLRGTRLTGHDLSGAVFDGCILFDVELYQCDLSDASFRNTVFLGGSVIDCSLKHADLSDATINYNGVLRRWDPHRCVLELSWKQFKSTRSYKTKNLDHCIVRLPMTPEPLDFSHGNLSHSWLWGELTGADFNNADIVETHFFQSKIAFKQLASTMSFRGRRLRIQLSARDDFESPFDFSGINLEGSILQNISENWKFSDARINGATLVGLTKQQLRSTASYKGGDLSRVVLAYCNLSHFDFAGINLTGSRFGQCQFHNASFDDAIITGANFYAVSTLPIPFGCEGLAIEQLKSSWDFKHKHLTTSGLPDELAEAIGEELAPKDVRNLGQ